jgi:hypothetical protein
MHIGPGSSGAPPSDLQNRHHEHFVQFYAQDDVLLQSLQRIVGGALGSGGSAVVVATEAHRRGLAKRLKWCGIDLQLAQACGRYREADAETVLASLEGDHPPLYFQELLHNAVFGTDGPAPGEQADLFVFGEVVGLMWERNRVREAVRLEQVWNRFRETRKFTLLCAYPVKHFHALEDLPPFSEVCAAHTAIVSDDVRMGIVSEWRPHGQPAQWTLLYQSAMLEPDQHRSFKKIETAEAAILTELEKTANDFPDQRSLVDALARLLILKRNRLSPD